jgi:hypothetical protein
MLTIAVRSGSFSPPVAQVIGHVIKCCLHSCVDDKSVVLWLPLSVSQSRELVTKSIGCQLLVLAYLGVSYPLRKASDRILKILDLLFCLSRAVVGDSRILHAVCDYK